MGPASRHVARHARPTSPPPRVVRAGGVIGLLMLLGLPLSGPLLTPDAPTRHATTRSGDATPGAVPQGTLTPGTVTPGSPTQDAPTRDPGACTIGARLVPTCGVLWGAAPSAHTGLDRVTAVRGFERRAGRALAVYHGYHRGTDTLFPTEQERALAREPGRPRILFLNWKPSASWARIATGRDRPTEVFLNRLAAHIATSFTEPFFLAIHHEPENEVREWAGSGYRAADYAAMFRHVVTQLRAGGATNIVPVLVFTGYPPWGAVAWLATLYPGDDVVDWVAWDAYAYSEPGYGYGDFAEMVDRRSDRTPGWPGFYTWAAARFPAKPLMISEWGVWFSSRNPAHQAGFYRSVIDQIALFPRIRALIFFDTPGDQQGRDSRGHGDAATVGQFRALGADPLFQVRLPPRGRT